MKGGKKIEEPGKKPRENSSKRKNEEVVSTHDRGGNMEGGWIEEKMGGWYR